MRVERLQGNPIIAPDMDARMGDNINGPSLIKVPAWVEKPLGKYYLYFAKHHGDYIRMAFADKLEGPWKMHEPGTLQLKHSYCAGHIASPDVHVDDARREILMYYHGGAVPPLKGQSSRLAISKDGLNFKAFPQDLGRAYFRVFRHGGYYYAITTGGLFLRSKDAEGPFEAGPTLFTVDLRHAAVKLDGGVLTVFFSNKRECPEHILAARMLLTPDWTQWKAGEAVSLLKPETVYEGADCPLVPSVNGKILERVNQLRDPGIYREGGDTHLLYSIAGEHGIAIGKLIEE
ncbi:MAG TPA: hypothetical protein PL033_01810 [Candidatus Brocadiia bacterium]|nr:hypothetical protein [Candidatus Brocadiia bacterium]